MVWHIILFFIGFFILIKGASVMIDGATSIAKRLRISNWIIGLTVIGIGTSIPEFSITLASALNSDWSISLGTILGSNTFNILVILGLAAIVNPLRAKAGWVKKELSANIIAVAVGFIFAVLPVAGGGFFEITKIEGLILLALFFAWIFYFVGRKRTQAENGEEEEPALKIFAIPLSLVLIGAGLLGVIVGARWVLAGGEMIARLLNVSEAVIGLTIVGIGTSLPELTVSLIAAHKGQPGISLGSIIGSNVFDFLGILGIASLFRNISFNRELMPDFLVTLGVSFLLLMTLTLGKKYTLQRWHGIIFFLLYIAYITFRLQ